MADGRGTDDPAALVERSLSADAAETFHERVAEQADWLRAQINAGRFDNANFAVGLEMECYAVDPAADHPQLTELPDAVFDAPGTNKELGLHNAEVNTEPTVFGETGLADQAAAIREHVTSARTAARAVDCELILDGMFSVPPPEGTDAYLSAIEERNGFVFAENMRPDPRYIAIDNATLKHANGAIELSLPGIERSFPTILVESLATSIQPHLQVPVATEFPAYYNTAIRTMGPVLALATNSPFAPADLYGEVADPAALLDETHHELRIAVFEQSVNATQNPKVKVPRDVDTPGDVLDRLVDDDLYAPFLREWIEGDIPRETLEGRVWELDHKRGTYWRWLRAVIGGDHVDANNDEHSLRIEYRPLPTQPTVTDVIGLQALTAGLVRGLVAADHPIVELPWEAAQRSFYAAARNGLDADIAWVTADGERTGDRGVIYDEIFTYASRGLEESGVPPAAIERYLAPIRTRWSERRTPSRWKVHRVRDALESGMEFAEALAEMQQAYIERSLTVDSFADF
ncbi:MAG: hypothetical protein ABEH64_09965 [Salinirussus sp.]